MIGDAVGILVLAAIVGVGLYDRLTDDEPAEGTVEAAHEAYREGRIGEGELERRLELAVDPEADRIREVVEPINGIAGRTSAALAHEFDTVEELKGASREEIQDVPGVGPKYADAIKERLE